MEFFSYRHIGIILIFFVYLLKNSLLQKGMRSRSVDQQLENCPWQCSFSEDAETYCSTYAVIPAFLHIRFATASISVCFNRHAITRQLSLWLERLPLFINAGKNVKQQGLCLHYMETRRSCKYFTAVLLNILTSVSDKDAQM